MPETKYVGWLRIADRHPGVATPLVRRTHHQPIEPLISTPVRADWPRGEYFEADDDEVFSQPIEDQLTGYGGLVAQLPVWPKTSAGVWLYRMHKTDERFLCLDESVTWPWSGWWTEDRW